MTIERRGRAIRDTFHGKTQFAPTINAPGLFSPEVSAPAALEAASFPSFDPARYAGELEGFDLTDEQRDLLLGTLWSVMRTFVELGFSSDICGQLLDRFTAFTLTESPTVESSNEATTETSEEERFDGLQ